MGPLDSFKRWVFGQARRKMDPLLKDGRRNIREIYTATSASTKGISSDVTYLGSDFSFSPMKKKKSACVSIFSNVPTGSRPLQSHSPPTAPTVFNSTTSCFLLFIFWHLQISNLFVWFFPPNFDHICRTDGGQSRWSQKS